MVEARIEGTQTDRLLVLYNIDKQVIFVITSDNIEDAQILSASGYNYKHVCGV